MFHVSRFLMIFFIIFFFLGGGGRGVGITTKLDYFGGRFFIVGPFLR